MTLNRTIVENCKSLPFEPVDIIEIRYRCELQINLENKIVLNPGEIVYVNNKAESGWWDGVVFRENSPGVRGWIPGAFAKDTNLLRAVKDYIRKEEEEQQMYRSSNKQKKSIVQAQHVHRQQKSKQKKTRQSRGSERSDSDRSDQTEPTDRPTYAHQLGQEPHTHTSSDGPRILTVDQVYQYMSENYSNGYTKKTYWLPQLGPYGEKVFYNADLDIYCTEMPDIDKFNNSNQETPRTTHLSRSNTSLNQTLSPNIEEPQKKSQKLLSIFKSIPKVKYDSHHDKYYSAAINRRNTAQRSNTQNLPPSSGSANTATPTISPAAPSLDSDSGNVQHTSGTSSSTKGTSGPSNTPNTPTSTHHNVAHTSDTASLNSNSNTNTNSTSVFSTIGGSTSTSVVSSTKHSKNIGHSRTNNTGANIINNSGNSKDTVTEKDHVERSSNSNQDHNATTSSPKEPFSQYKISSNVYEVNDYFKQHPKDFKSWEDFKDTLFVLLERSLKALVERDGPGFSAIFTVVGKVCSMAHILYRQYQADLSRYGFEVGVQKRMEQITRSLALIGVCARLFLSIRNELVEQSNDDLVSGANVTNAISVNGAQRNSSIGVSNDLDELFEHEPFNNSITEDSKSSSSNTSNSKVFTRLLEQSAEYDLKRNTDRGSSVAYLDTVKNEIKLLKKHVIAIHSTVQKLNKITGKPVIVSKIYAMFLDDKAGFDSSYSLLDTITGKMNQLSINKYSIGELSEAKKALSRSLIDIKDSIKVEISPQTNNLVVEKQISATVNTIYTSLNCGRNYLEILDNIDTIILCDGSNTNTNDMGVVVDFYESRHELQSALCDLVMCAQDLAGDESGVFEGFSKIPEEPTLWQHNASALKSSGGGYGILINTVEANFTSPESFLRLAIDRAEHSATVALRSSTELIQTQEDVHKSASQSGSKSVADANARGNPWYLESESDYELYYSASGEIKGGTKEVLVTYLTNHETLDETFNETFLITFKSMMTLEEFVTLMINRFNVQPPDGLSFDEFHDWYQKKAYAVRLRCVNIMKRLIQKYWIESYSKEKEALEIWLKFAQELAKDNFPTSKTLVEELQKKVAGEPSVRKSVMTWHVTNPYEEPVPIPFYPENEEGGHVKRLWDINYIEFARQLTIQVFAHYSRLNILQFLNRTWKNKYGDLGSGDSAISDFSALSNKFSLAVSCMILSSHNVKVRAKTIEYFILVANECFKINNYSSLMDIISALNSSPVGRLRRTWSAIEPSIFAVYQRLNKFISYEKNFISYLDHMKQFNGIGVPCIPCIAIYLTHLVFVQDGVPDILNNDQNILNFYKRYKIVSVINNILNFQSISYNFVEIDSIQNFMFAKMNSSISLESLYQISIILESRSSSNKVSNKGSELQNDLRKLIDPTNFEQQQNTMQYFAQVSALEDSLDDEIDDESLSDKEPEVEPEVELESFE